MTEQVEALAADIDAALDKFAPGSHPDLAQAIAEHLTAGWQLTRVGDEERLRGMRPVLVDEDILEKWGTRTERGERITAEWGEPDERGWYNPTFTVHADDRLCADEERLRALSDAATPGPWKARTGHPADTFEPDGYKYVQFGPTEAKATGLGTDQLKPADAELIAAAVNYVRERLAPQPPSPASQGEER